MFTASGESGRHPAVSALEIDGGGRIWAASAYAPDRDRGPFHSAVWEIGRCGAGADGGGEVTLSESPRRVAHLDGVKTESLAMEGSGSETQLFVGTDDEGFGGLIRRLSLDTSTTVAPGG